MRIGFGFDDHAFGEDRRLVIGGEEIPPYVDKDGRRLGLAGYSDADVLLHSIAEALLGAAALGDMGKHFPSTDPQWEGADSRDLLRRVVAMLHMHGHTVVNVDAMLIAQEPHLAPYIQAMRCNIAEIVGTGVGQVSVKASTTQALGAIGRCEGIAVFTVVLIE